MKLFVYEEIKDWVNSKNDEGYTPLHFASFRGNIVLIIISLNKFFIRI